jgi:hypothetical protein
MMKCYDYERQDQDFNEHMKITEHGPYLHVQYCEHPVHIYKRVEPGAKVHPFVERIGHNGHTYRLVAIEDDKV